MLSQSFKIGDKVEVTKQSGYEPINFKKVGRVCSVMGEGDEYTIGVTFKNWTKGHSCGYKAKTTFSGWNYLSRHLELTNKSLTDFKEELL